MKRLGKKNHSIEMSIEAYKCNCGECNGCGCVCGDAIRNAATANPVPTATSTVNNGFQKNYNPK